MNMWGATRSSGGGNKLTLVEAINRVEIMQKTHPLVQWAARLPSNRLAYQMYEQAFQGECPGILCALAVNGDTSFRVVPGLENRGLTWY